MSKITINVENDKHSESFALSFDSETKVSNEKDILKAIEKFRKEWDQKSVFPEFPQLDWPTFPRLLW